MTDIFILNFNNTWGNCQSTYNIKYLHKIHRQKSSYMCMREQPYRLQNIVNIVIWWEARVEIVLSAEVLRLYTCISCIVTAHVTQISMRNVSNGINVLKINRHPFHYTSHLRRFLVTSLEIYDASKRKKNYTNLNCGFFDVLCASCSGCGVMKRAAIHNVSYTIQPRLTFMW